MKELEERFIDMTLAHDEVFSSNTNLEMELSNLKDYIRNTHVEGFNQAMFLYGVSAGDNKFDFSKDIYQG